MLPSFDLSVTFGEALPLGGRTTLVLTLVYCSFLKSMLLANIGKVSSVATPWFKLVRRFQICPSF